MQILKLFVLAVMLAVPGMASAADQLPKGFIALSESEMTWDDARDFCRQRGGRLPLISGSGSLANVPSGTPIDGFGSRGAPWPSGLPSDLYWTGTAGSDGSGEVWRAVDYGGNGGGGKVHVFNDARSGVCRVVCVSGTSLGAERKAVPLDTKNAVYTKILKEYLGRNGLPDAEPQIMQLFKVDLDGDGQDEIVIYAQNIIGNMSKTWGLDFSLCGRSRFPSGEFTQGKYSVLLVRKIVDGKVREIPLSQFITPGDSPILLAISQFADLNGDGIMKIITSECSDEGFTNAVYEIKGDKAVKSLRESVTVSSDSWSITIPVSWTYDLSNENSDWGIPGEIHIQSADASIKMYVRYLVAGDPAEFRAQNPYTAFRFDTGDEGYMFERPDSILWLHPHWGDSGVSLWHDGNRSLFTNNEGLILRIVRSLRGNP